VITPAPKKWLSIIGIGEDGVAGLSPAARSLLAQAELVVGGSRHLALAGPLAAATLTWPSPIHDAIPKIAAWRGQLVCVLASGDPFFYGIGALLAAHFDPGEIECLPTPSAFSLAAARLKWSLQDCGMISLHGRELERIIPLLQPNAKILALSWDETTPSRLAQLLKDRCLGQCKITVMEAIGGGHERVRASIAEEFCIDGINPLNLVAVEVVANVPSQILPVSQGLADGWFETDGQLTKREIRSIALSSLAPRRGDLLWDVGAGSGSIAIEWLLCDPANRAIAIEKRADRASRIACNAARLGVPQLQIVTGEAPDALASLPQPQAVFIGGGANSGVLDKAYASLPPGGRLVAHAVTLETEVLLVSKFKALGGELFRIDIARADPLGRFHGWRPARPVIQWAVTKP